MTESGPSDIFDVAIDFEVFTKCCLDNELNTYPALRKAIYSCQI